MAVRPVPRSVVSRRLRQSGARFQGGSYPTDRRSWAWLTGEGTPDAAPATRDEALSLPAFGRGVELIASTVASTPFRAHRWNPGTGVDERVADQPQVCTDPDPLSTPWHWRYAVTKDLVEAGNHISLLGDTDWRTGLPGWLVPVPIELVGVIFDPENPARWWFTVAGTVMDPADVLHISAGNRSGEVLGRGIVAQYAERLGEQLTAEKWAGKYLSGGGLPPAVIQAAGEPTQVEADDFKKRWRTMMATGEAVLIPRGATVVPLVSDAQRQQLVEARQWNAQACTIMLGIPHHMFGLPGSSSTYQNVQEADIAWEKYTVDRWAQPIVETLSKRLMPSGWSVRPDYSARLRTDTQTQAQVVTTLVGGPLLSRDEGRMMLGRPPEGTVLDEGSTPAGVPDLGPQEVR